MIAKIAMGIAAALVYVGISVLMFNVWESGPPREEWRPLTVGGGGAEGAFTWLNEQGVRCVTVPGEKGRNGGGNGGSATICGNGGHAEGGRAGEGWPR